MNILVVDDAVFVRKMLGDILRRNGHTVVGEASNGREALEKYKALHPDLVTMDITMNEVNGLEGIKLIRAYDDNAKVIMCSAMGQQAMVIEAIHSGAIDFIVKPFDAERVKTAISKVERQE